MDSTENKRIVLAQRICDLFVEQEVETDDAVASLHIVMNLIRPSGLAIVRTQAMSAGGEQGVAPAESAYPSLGEGSC
jgi:hypothetical protein